MRHAKVHAAEMINLLNARPAARLYTLRLSKAYDSLANRRRSHMKTAIGVGLSTDENWDEFSDYVIEAERMGVDSVWSAEAWGHDGATPLAYLAAKTSRIKLGSGILQTVGRTPANLAMTAMTLQSMSGGRFLLGLGVSGS